MKVFAHRPGINFYDPWSAANGEKTDDITMAVVSNLS